MGSSRLPPCPRSECTTRHQARPLAKRNRSSLAQVHPLIADGGRLESLAGKSHAVDPLPRMLPQHQHCGQRDLLAGREDVLAQDGRREPIRFGRPGLRRWLDRTKIGVEAALIAPSPIAGAWGLTATLRVPSHVDDCTASVLRNDTRSARSGSPAATHWKRRLRQAGSPAFCDRASFVLPIISAPKGRLRAAGTNPAARRPALQYRTRCLDG